MDLMAEVRQLKQKCRTLQVAIGLIAVAIVFQFLAQVAPTAAAVPERRAEQGEVLEVVKARRVEIIDDGKIRLALGSGQIGVPLIVGEMKVNIPSGLILFDADGQTRAALGMTDNKIPALYFSNRRTDALVMTTDQSGSALEFVSCDQSWFTDSGRKFRSVLIGSSGAFGQSGVSVTYGANASARLWLGGGTQPAVEVQNEKRQTLFKAP